CRSTTGQSRDQLRAQPHVRGSYGADGEHGHAAEVLDVDGDLFCLEALVEHLADGVAEFQQVLVGVVLLCLDAVFVHPVVHVAQVVGLAVGVVPRHVDGGDSRVEFVLVHELGVQRAAPDQGKDCQCGDLSHQFSLSVRWARAACTSASSRSSRAARSVATWARTAASVTSAMWRVCRSRTSRVVWCAKSWTGSPHLHQNGAHSCSAAMRSAMLMT